MNAEFPEAITFVAIHLTSVAANKHLALDDLGVEQGGSSHHKGQKQGKYSKSLHCFSFCIIN
jgi:hypothetical protein